MRLPQFFCLLLLFITGQLLAQSSDAEPVQDTVVSTEGDVTVLTINNGQEQQKQRFKNGKRQGLQEVYWYGKLLTATMYKDGFPDGEELGYYDGKLKRKQTYRRKGGRSVLEGKSYAYKPDGSLHSITVYKDSLRHGKYTLYYDNGQVASGQEYERDLLSGRSLEYLDNGQLTRDQGYTVVVNNDGHKESVLHGDCSYYTREGKISAKGRFDKGKKTGLWKEYHYNSKQLKTRATYEDGEIHGRFDYWYEDGKPESSGTVYRNVEVDGKMQYSVYDGALERYHKNGILDCTKSYDMGKATGTWLSYYENGKLKERNTYEDGLETGTSVYYDAQGRLTSSIAYTIQLKDGIEASVQHGETARYADGILVERQHFVNGMADGKHERFYPGGELMEVREYAMGKHSGATDYHENGRIKRSSTQLSVDLDPQAISNISISRTYDPEGRLEYEQASAKGEELMSARYKWGIPVRYTVNGLLEMRYFPDGSLMGLSLGARNFGSPEIHYFRSGAIRKIEYDDPVAMVKKIAEFSDDGRLLSVYAKQGQEDKASGTDYPQKLAGYANPEWRSAKLFADSIKNGRYELSYSNGTPFIKAGFSNGLPDGDFIVFEPESNDTILYRNYRSGLQIGASVAKFAGKTATTRAGYYDNGQLLYMKHAKPDGTPTNENGYDELGKRSYNVDYNENGMVERRSNYVDDTSIEYGADGLPVEETAKLDGKPGWRVDRSWYPGTTQLSALQYTSEAGRDSISTFYHKNGQVQYVFGNKGYDRHGSFREYSDTGTLLAMGQYQNGKPEGEWVSYKDGKTDRTIYKDGKPVVETPTAHCGCIETELPNTTVFYAPGLHNLVGLEELKHHLPPAIVPADEFNYRSIFYRNAQFDAGSASMQLIMQKELALYVPAEKQVKLTLNPCRTEGYRSLIRVDAHYDADDPANMYATLDPKRIAVALQGGPLESADADYPGFTALFNTKYVEITHEYGLNISVEDDAEACFSRGSIRDFLAIEATDGQPMLTGEPAYFVHSELHPENMPEEMWQVFYGVFIGDAKVGFSLEENGEVHHYSGVGGEIYAGTAFVSGKVVVPCKKTGDDEYRFADENSSFNFSAKALKSEWEKRGFTLLEMKYDNTKQALALRFFIK